VVNDLARLVGSLGVVLLVPMLIIWAVFSFSLPFLCWSVVRNVAAARRALERIADAQRPTPGAGGLLGL
jgi:hypothetical protein